MTKKLTSSKAKKTVRFSDSKLEIITVKVPLEDYKAAKLRVRNMSMLMRTLLRMYLRGDVENVVHEELKSTLF